MRKGTASRPACVNWVLAQLADLEIIVAQPADSAFQVFLLLLCQRLAPEVGEQSGAIDGDTGVFENSFGRRLFGIRLGRLHRGKRETATPGSPQGLRAEVS